MRHDHDSDLVFSDDLPDEELDKLLAEMTETVFSDDMSEEELDKLLAITDEHDSEDKSKHEKEIKSENKEISLSILQDALPNMSLMIDDEPLDKSAKRDNVDKEMLNFELEDVSVNHLSVDETTSHTSENKEEVKIDSQELDEFHFEIDDITPMYQEKKDTLDNIDSQSVVEKNLDGVEKDDTLLITENEKSTDDLSDVLVLIEEPTLEHLSDSTDKATQKNTEVLVETVEKHEGKLQHDILTENNAKTETVVGKNAIEVVTQHQPITVTDNADNDIVLTVRKSSVSSTIDIEDIKKLSEKQKAKDVSVNETALSDSTQQNTENTSEKSDEVLKNDGDNQPSHESTNPVTVTLATVKTQQGNPVMNDESIQSIKQQISTLQSQLHDLSGKFFLANETSAKLISQVRELQLNDKNNYQTTYEQAHELRTKIITSRKQFMELTSLLDLVEEALAGDVYNKQTK